MTQKLIPPSVGRKLYYWPADYDRTTSGLPGGVTQFAGHEEGALPGRQPLDATILYVHADGAINVMVQDHAGNQRFRPSVTLVQDGDPAPADQSYCYYWMPFQVGQAKKDAPAIAPTAPQHEIAMLAAKAAMYQHDSDAKKAVPPEQAAAAVVAAYQAALQQLRSPAALPPTTPYPKEHA